MTRGLRYSLTLAVVAMATVCGCRNASQVADRSETAAQISASAISMSCLVRKYEADGSYYATRQHQSIEPYEGIIQVSGTEPAGQYFLQLSGNLFTGSEGRGPEAKWLPSQMSAADYCRLVLGSFQAGMVGQSQDGSPVRIRGNWAYPVKSDDALAWYQSKENSAVADIVTLESPDGGRYIARGYGYHLTRDSQMLVPAKIEIFRTDATAMTEQMLLRLDYPD
jgi:hypothetical protein